MDALDHPMRRLKLKQSIGVGSAQNENLRLSFHILLLQITMTFPVLVLIILNNRGQFEQEVTRLRDLIVLTILTLIELVKSRVRDYTQRHPYNPLRRKLIHTVFAPQVLDLISVHSDPCSSMLNSRDI